MKIDPTELAHLAAVQPRMDLYGPIHKALRAYMADTLLALGRADTDDAGELAAACGQVAALMDFCLGHVQHEEQHVHPALEARAAGACAAVAHEHGDHRRDAAALRDAAIALPGLEGALRPVAAARLYQALALFVGDNFRHMHAEETAHNAVLWARYTDAELVDLHDRLVASVAPQEMATALRWMLPAMSPAERAAMLGDMRAKLPAPAFAGVLDIAREHLRPAQWARLAAALGLPAVPGLVAA